MFTLRIEWKYVLKIPFHDRVHEVLHAFLRTSEQGEWTPNEEIPSDAFVLNYRRGRWQRRWFGRGEWLPEPWHSCFGDATRNAGLAPMELRITLRPTPSEVTIGIYHFAYLRGGPTPYQKQQKQADETALAHLVDSEVKALAEYLREVYDLPEPPQIAEAD